MIVPGPKQRIATAASITTATSALGMIRGTAGAKKILIKLWGQSAAGTFSAPVLRPSWDGLVSTGVAIPTSILTQVLDSFTNVNGLAEHLGVVWEIWPAANNPSISLPALHAWVTGSAALTTNADAWVYHEAEYESYLRRGAGAVSSLMPS